MINNLIYNTLSIPYISIGGASGMGHNCDNYDLIS